MNVIKEENELKAEKAGARTGALRVRTRVALAGVLMVVTAGMLLWACFTFGGAGRGESTAARMSSEFLFHGATFSRDEIIRMEAAFAAAGLKDYRISEGKVEIPAARRDQYILALQKHEALPREEAFSQEPGGKSLLPPTGKELEHQRTLAKQHSLARQIEKFRGIESAQVTLDFQQKMNGLAQTRTATASVVVRSRPGVDLLETDIQAIRGVVAGSVADLHPENLVVVDTRVNRCWQGCEDAPAGMRNAETKKSVIRENLVDSGSGNGRDGGGNPTYASQKIQTLDDVTLYVLQRGQRNGSGGQAVQVLPASYTKTEEKTPAPELPFSFSEMSLCADGTHLPPLEINTDAEKVGTQKKVAAVPAQPPVEISEARPKHVDEHADHAAPGNLHLYEAGIGVLIFAVTGFLAAIFGNMFSRKKEPADEKTLTEETITEETVTDTVTQCETPHVPACETPHVSDEARESESEYAESQGHVQKKELPEDVPHRRSEMKTASATPPGPSPEAVTAAEEKPSPVRETSEKTYENEEFRRISETLFGQSQAGNTQGVRENHAADVTLHPADMTPSATEISHESPRESAREERKHTSRKSLRDLKTSPPEYVADVLKTERPQVTALVLRHVDETQREAVLRQFSPEAREEIRGRMAECGWADEDILNDVLDSVAARVYAMMPAQKKSASAVAVKRTEAQPAGPFSLETPQKVMVSGPVKIFMEDEYREEILAGCTGVARDDKKTSETRRMPEMPRFSLPAGMTYDDAACFHDDALRTILQEAEPEMAMYGFMSACPRLQERFLNVMPASYASGIKACMKEMAPMRVCDLEESRRRMVTLIQKLATEGKIEIPAELYKKAA